MKNIWIWIVAAIAIIAVGGIAWSTTHQQPTTDNTDASPAVTATDLEDTTVATIEEGDTMSQSKTLVLYFSRADENYSVGTVDVGNTAMLVPTITAATSADTFEIVPAEKYPAEYQAATEVAKAEQEAGSRPAYVGDIDLAGYDTIFLGYPIWWGDLPMCVYTFLENHDFTGKTIHLFNTHEGSGDAGTYDAIARLLPTATVDTNGLAVYGHTARTESSTAAVSDWLTSLGY